MRDTARSLWLLASMALRADPWRAAFILFPSYAVGLAIGEWSTKEIVDASLAGDRAALYRWVAIAGAGGAAWISMALTRFTIDMRLREEMGVELDERLIRTIGDIPTTDHHERPEIADELELLRTNRGQLLGGVGGLGQAVHVAFSVATGAGLLYSVDPAAALLPLAGIPLVVLSRSAARINQAVATETAEKTRQALHLYDLGTSPDAAEELRIFGLEQTVQDRYRDAWMDSYHKAVRAGIQAGALVSIGSLALTVGLVAILLSIADRAASGDISPGQLVMVFGVLTNMGWQFRSFAGIAAWIVDIAVTAGRLRTLEDHARAVDDAGPWHHAAVDPPDRLSTGIEFRGVSFAYPGADQPSLRDVDLVLPAGTTVAVVGDNGAGKSTLVSLLCGLRLPTEGTITVDGIDLASIRPDRWRERLSAGFQDHARFEVTAGHNVGLGDVAHLDDVAETLAALERAGSADVVSALAEGLGTALGASLDGADLSGGQWQKLALGRAMMRHAPVLLVLDEPTSALDAETEHRLFETYARAARDTAGATGCVTVLVSHRFSTVRTADLIVVLDGGRVVEVGSHADLHARGGLYAELYDLQAAAYR